MDADRLSAASSRFTEERFVSNTTDAESRAHVTALFAMNHSHRHHNQEPTGNYSHLQRKASDFLHSRCFEYSMAVVVLTNLVVIVVETDKGAKEETLPLWCNVTSWSILISFILELALKLFVLRSRFHHDRWNVFDFIVIGADSTMSIVGLFNDSLMSVSQLRILRLSRIARASKVIQVFPELRLMLAGLMGALNAIFWGTVLLFSVILIWAVVAVQFIHPLNVEIVDTTPEVYHGCGRCARAYESTFQAVLTFSTQVVAGDSWGRETVPIIERYPISACFFAGVYLSVGLAVLNLILGVVVNIATEERERMVRVMAEEKQGDRKDAHLELERMCRDMDADGNDELNVDEIKSGYEENEAFRATLKRMDIGREDLDVVWAILDEHKTGTITSHEFTTQIFRLKDSESQFLLAYMRYYLMEIKEKLRAGQDVLKNDLKAGQEILHLQMTAAQEKLRREIQRSRHTEGDLHEACNDGAEDITTEKVASGRELDSDFVEVNPARERLPRANTEPKNGLHSALHHEDCRYFGERPRPHKVRLFVPPILGDKPHLDLDLDPVSCNDGSFGSLQLLVEHTQTLRVKAERAAAKSILSTDKHPEGISEIHSIAWQCVRTIDEAQQQYAALAKVLACQSQCLTSVIECLFQAKTPSVLPVVNQGSHTLMAI